MRSVAQIILGAMLPGIHLPAAQQCPASWDGTSGQTHGSDEVRAMCVFETASGTVLYVGGRFTLQTNLNIRYVACWDGRAFSAVGGGVSNSVNDLAIFDDGEGPALYATGFFSLAEGQPVNHIAKWDGNRWSALDRGLPGAFAEGIALTGFDDGRRPALYVGGSFVTAGSVQANGIARWDGQSWEALGSGLSGACYSLAVFDDGGGPALYVGGDFLRAGGMTVNGIARWNGTTWSAVGGGVTHPGTAVVGALAVFDDGNGEALYAGGRFTHAGGVPAANIARWDGLVWSALGQGANLTIAELTVDEGYLYAGGGFTVIDGVSAERVARWDGFTWEALGLGVAKEVGCCAGVGAMAAFPSDPHGPSVYLGGAFDHAGGLAANNLARWGCPYLLGDVTCDGSVNIFDIDAFLLALSDPAGYAAAWPDCFLSRADANNDGSINQFDIQPFIEVLSP